MELRLYQHAANNALLKHWRNQGGNALIEMGTGLGKSVIIADLVKGLLSSYPDLRVLMLVHVRELVSQNLKALINLWPQAPVGINSAGLGRRDYHHQILFASIQSIYKHAARIGPRDLIVVDECHLMPHDGEGMYRRLLQEIDAPHEMRVVGFSATAYRLDSGRLDQGKGRLFEKVVFKYGIGEGIEDGWLSPLISKATATILDTKGVERRGGEFVPGQLEQVINQGWITRAAVDEIVRYGENRRSWLAFCCGVKHAHEVAAEIRLRGVSCEAITGETPKGERDRLVRDFKSGAIRCLTNAQVLTTGFDAPSTDLIAMLRPTLSAGLYVQICGRGTRLAEGKENCLVLDFARNILRFGPVDTVEAGNTKPKGEGGPALAKECPHCATLVALAARICPTCGYEWPPRDEAPKHEATADANASILSKGAPVWVDVDSVRYYRHEKQGSPASLRAEYHCGYTVHRAWQCFDHQGFARQKAESWWRRCAQSVVPRTTEEALRRVGELECPAQVQVRPDGKYFSIVAYRFAEQKERVA